MLLGLLLAWYLRILVGGGSITPWSGKGGGGIGSD